MFPENSGCVPGEPILCFQRLLYNGSTKVHDLTFRDKHGTLVNTLFKVASWISRAKGILLFLKDLIKYITKIKTVLI